MFKKPTIAICASLLILTGSAGTTDALTVKPTVQDTSDPSLLSYEEAKYRAKRYVRPRLSDKQWECIKSLWNHESHWNYRAGSIYGPYGIPQANPGTKMATIASDWRYNPVTQVKWGLRYIRGRYETPCRAWNHFRAYNWY